jgi:dolichol-phosphate mannosyltransferase
MDKILVFIPTYNEYGNVKRLYQEIKKLSYNLDILFCDDNSPDGTGKLIDELVNQDSSVHVIHRPAKMGLGTSYVEAFNYVRKHNYDYLIIMDADFTHDPSYIPSLIAQKDRADIVIGSRYASGGKMEGWNKIRLPFTYFWRGMIKHGLGLPYDSTGAFRLYHVSILKPEIYTKLTSKGFSFGMEALYRFKQNGARIVEVPILARQRQEGKSKLSVKIMSEFAKQYFRLVVERLFCQQTKVTKVS